MFPDFNKKAIQTCAPVWYHIGMKKAAVIMLIMLLITLFAGSALADPSQSPETSPAVPDNTASPDASALIAYNSTGETVVRIQLRLRELGYFNYKPTGNFGTMSVEATKRFQQKQTDAAGQAIMADGTVGAQSLSILFERTAVRSDIIASIPFGAALSGTPAVTGELVEWNEVKTLLGEGASYTVTDYNTGTQWSMIFTGGEYHAEMECASPEDAAVYKETFGGEYNYSKRPVVVNIAGRLVAASLQGYPHGSDTVSSNDMAGHACLFFSGSLSHVGGFPDVEHQSQIYKAAGRS